MAGNRRGQWPGIELAALGCDNVELIWSAEIDMKAEENE